MVSLIPVTERPSNGDYWSDFLDMSMAAAFCGPKRSSDDFITGVTHVLIDKVRDKRAAWENDINSPKLSTNAITERFFTPGSDVPKLAFHPSSGSTDPERKDSTYGRFREWGLPEMYYVQGLVTGDAKDSGAFKLTEDEVVERVLAGKGETKGTGRAEDMERITRELVGRYCTTVQGGYLDWTRSNI